MLRSWLNSIDMLISALTGESEEEIEGSPYPDLKHWLFRRTATTTSY